MNDRKNTARRLDDLIESVSNLETVNPPPFFKDRVLNKLQNSSMPEVSQYFPHWFTPNYQIATLLLFVVLNVATLYYYNSTIETSELQTFAQAYGLSTSEEETILN